MRIRELTLRNYRVHADPPAFRFSEGFTVVAGVNGGARRRYSMGSHCSLTLPAARFPCTQRLSPNHSFRGEDRRGDG